MQQIKESTRTREDVIRESRAMLHAAFDQLEANEQVIGDDIRNRTAEEMNLGKCPVCGGMLAIKHMRGNTQFIGCSRYPDWSFNIGLPRAQWGFAIRTDDICDRHNLNFVRLVRKGARPWDIGCPLCHHISSNRESLSEIPSMTPALADNILAHHIYTVAELARSVPEDLAKRLGIPGADAGRLVTEADAMLEKLRRRSECRKFLRDRLIPRKGRSYAKIMEVLKGHGIMELAGLAHADPAALKSAGIGDAEAGQVIADAKIVYYGQVLRDMGIPAVSLKKYLTAGFTTPDAFCELAPETLSERTGMSLATVQKHIALVCRALNRPAPKKVSKLQTEKGRKELLTIKGLGEQAAEKLILAGVTDGRSLLAADPPTVARETGIPVQTIRDYQAVFRKKLDIIQL
jgi:DNA topoisomerase-1